MHCKHFLRLHRIVDVYLFDLFARDCRQAKRGKAAVSRAARKIARNCPQFVGKLDCFQPARQRKRSQTLFCIYDLFCGFFNFFPMKRNKFCDGRLCDAKSSSKRTQRLAPQYLRLASAI